MNETERLKKLIFYILNISILTLSILLIMNEQTITSVINSISVN
jgi:hypothetical protein